MGCIIAVHGWLADHHLFDPLLHHVDLACLDCRGYGARRDVAGPFRIATIADDVLALADDRGWDTFHVLGHSMGGQAAQGLMVRAAHRLRSAILVAPVPACGSRISTERRQFLERAIHDPDVRRELIDVNTGHRHNQRWLDDLLRLSLDSANPDALRAYITAWTETDFAAAMPATRTPILAIAGRHDPAVPLSLLRDTIQTWRPDAVVVELEDAGHYPMLESPVALARHIQSVIGTS